ncbi:hypothetical protein B0H13DRAFT_1871681 [Mycena leptocephala]|nr:hypothetical protein B0H13DRAFT_1871681 [Mycena leptocephala]
MPPATPKTGVRVRDEFLNCDFSTVGQMVDFAHHPFMARVSREILEPLYQFFLRIREDFTWSPETKTKGEKRVMRQRVRDYLEMAGRLSDYVIRHHDLAEAKRIPTPRVAWLQVVMRADSVYGFEGDDNQLLRSRDDEGTRTQRAFNPKSENPFYGLPGVIEEGEVEAMETLASTKFAHVEYVRSTSALSANSSADVFLRRSRCLMISLMVGPSSFVPTLAHLEKAAFLYSAALEYAKSNIEAPFLDPSVIWSLTMARTFHYMIGQPTYGYSRECCDAFLGRISSALSFADRTRTSASHTDVPLSVEIASLPHVPSWTRDRINHLCILELNDAWTCENALLQDEIEASQGIGRGLEKAVAQAEAGYGQNPSGRDRGAHSRRRQRIVEEHGGSGQGERNIWETAEGEEPAFFVPSEGTTLFGMAERFVDLYGFHEDSSLLDRAILFENLCTLQEAMIRNPGYLELGIDFPNFDLSRPSWSGAPDRPSFGDSFPPSEIWRELLRYNPELGKKEGIRSPIFRWRDCPHVLTHPNRWRNPKKLDRTQHPFRSWGCYGTDFDERMDWSRCWELYYGWNVKSSRILPLVAHRNTSSRMPQLVIRRPDGPPSAISRNAHILQELCLPLETLDTLGFTPDEPWSEFFEFRLRPMGVYSLGELEEIRHWVHQALLHCRLLLVCRKALQPVYEDDFSISCPPTWGIPGEAVAMFEIMYRICLSIGFPCSDDSLCPLDRHVLLPLIMGARETRALLKTADDYSAYNRFGEVIDADRFIGGLARIIKQERGRASASDSESSSPLGICERRAKIGIGVFSWFANRGGHLPENPGENALCTCVPVFLVITSLRSLVLVYCWCSAAEIPLVVNLISLVDASRSFSSLLPPWITRRVESAPTRVWEVFQARIFSSISPKPETAWRPPPFPRVVALLQEKALSDAVRARVERFVGFLRRVCSGSESDDDLVDPADLLAPSQRNPQRNKTQKRPVDAMDVDEEGSAVSNAAESSSKPVERPAPRLLPVKGVCRPFSPSLLVLAVRWRVFLRCRSSVQTRSSIWRPSTSRETQINDSFDFDVRRSSVDGISRMYEFYTRDAEEIGKEYKKVEARDPDGFRRLVEPLDALPSDPDDPVFLDARPAAPLETVHPRRFLPSTASRTPQWRTRARGTSISWRWRNDASESEKETRFWRSRGRARAYREKIPATNTVSRVLTYIEERKRAVANSRRALTCGLLHSSVRAQFEGEDRVLDRVFSARPAQALAASQFASPPRHHLRQFLVRGARRCQLSLISPSSSRGRILGRTISLVGPAQVQREEEGVVASRESREKSRAESEGEPEVDPEIITCTVKVKKGKRQSAVELTGPKNEYDSQLWHDATTSLDASVAFWQTTNETPTAACTHCRADNTCELSPVEFDWEMTDAALPDVNAEWMELQLTLMLEIADEVGGVGTTERLLARFMRHLRSMGTDQDVLEAENSSVAGKIGHRAHSSSRGGEDDETDDSGTEVEGGKGGEDGDVSMGQDKGSQTTSLRSRRARALLGDRLPRPRPPSLTMDSVESLRARFALLASPGDPRRMFPQRRRANRPGRGLPSKALSRPSSPPVVVSPALSLSTSIFGKAGVLLGSKPNETSEGFVRAARCWRRGNRRRG